MSIGAGGYDREWTKPVGPRSRIRVGYTHDGGRVTRFVVQLEYRLDDGWAEVVRADHDESDERSHDVTEEGAHVDVYRDGEKFRTEELSPPTPTGVAFTFAEAHLSWHAERYVERFEEWHGIDHRDQ